jgi:hypothetical protein
MHGSVLCAHTWVCQCVYEIVSVCMSLSVCVWVCQCVRCAYTSLSVCYVCARVGLQCNDLWFVLNDCDVVARCLVRNISLVALINLISSFSLSIKVQGLFWQPAIDCAYCSFVWFFFQVSSAGVLWRGVWVGVTWFLIGDVGVKEERDWMGGWGWSRVKGVERWRIAPGQRTYK